MSQANPSSSSAPLPVVAPHQLLRLGDVLIDLGFVTPEQLKRALSESKATGTPLGATLVKLGVIDEVSLGKALAKLHGLQYLDTHGVKLDPEVMGLLSEDFMKRHRILPLRLDAKTRRLEVIMARPDQVHVLDEVALRTGYKPIARVSTHHEIARLLDAFFVNRTSADDALAKLEEDLRGQDITNDLNAELEAELEANDAPVVQLVNSLLTDAIAKNASDVHIEAQQERLLVRFRIDGILHEVQSIPKKMAAAVISRIKVTSGMDIAERRRPQDGRMKLKVGSQEIDMRVNSLVVQFGEKIVVRILKSTATTGGLEKLGLRSDEAKRMTKMIKAPHGIILVTGPTGSGKTTTLYSCLREINSPERNITTIEDPIEYPLAGINQTQVSHKSGLTFSMCLRAILRQDPDVIMVGEIRDEETLEAAIHAALTGHLVFSTIHTNSTAKTVNRLMEMGAAPYLVSSSVIGIVAQRLVRRLCDHCKNAYEASPEELEILGQSDINEPVTLYHSEGCERCNFTGYQGRVGLYEIMDVDRSIQELIDQRASTLVIEDTAIKAGMRTLAMDGKLKAQQGMTTLSELTRVLGMDLTS
jgi:type IV pilus assembly protein PilB